MILTIDIGNSNIVSVLYDKEGNRLADDRRQTLKQTDLHAYTFIFSSIEKVLSQSNFVAIVLSCVVPAITDCVEKVILKKYPNALFLNVSVASVPHFNLKLDIPNALGSDIVATTFGAFYKSKQPTIVADLGSATKVTLVEENRTFCGGIIMPGMYFMAQSLHDMIPQLPVVEMEKPDKIIGTNTMMSIQSGIINGTLASIIEQAKQIEKEIGKSCHWLITGGLSKLFSNSDLHKYIYDEFLLSDGLYFIAKESFQDRW